MKIIKHVSFLLCIYMLASCEEQPAKTNGSAAAAHGNLVLGKMVAGSPVVTPDPDTLNAQWSNVFMKSGAVESFQTFKIVKTDSTYNLIGTNAGGSAAAAIELHYDPERHQFYEIIYPEDISYTVLCQGCKSGCYPKIVRGQAACTPACDSCKKTVVGYNGRTFH